MINYREALKAKINNIPEAPGIYKMLDSNGKIIYIGKSKCLKKRVKSYFVDFPKWDKVKRMAPLIRDIEYEVTDTHLEAMLLECKLIKEIKPYFNVQMKNDSRYVYVKVGTDDDSAPLTVVHERGKLCYGPYRSKHVLQNKLDILKNLYPIEKSKGKYQFEYHVLAVTMNCDENKKNRKALKEMFSHTEKMALFEEQLEQRMQDAAANYQFESAAKYRDAILAVRYFKNGIARYKELLEKDILLKLKVDKGEKLIFVAKGQVICKKRYTDLSKQNQELFIKEARKKSSIISITINDKSSIDFQDVLYSEIMKLPKESIYMLENDF